MNYLENIGKNAKKAFEDLKAVKHSQIIKVLENYNKSLLDNKQKIVKENHKDVKNSKRKNLVDRLILNKTRIETIRHSINEIAKFKNPIGRVLENWKRSNKLNIKRLLIPTPIFAASIMAQFIQLLPNPIITTDLVKALKIDNVVSGNFDDINSLDIVPKSPYSIVPTYLK